MYFGELGGKNKMIYEKELSDKIIGAAIEVHKELGYGFLEKVYENALVFELRNLNINCDNQKPIEVRYKNHLIGDYFADIIVENKIILELKVCETLTNIHKAQLMNYLKATGMKIGYLINFASKGKLEFKRLVY